eukprot:TRINITY_DN16850_c0_g1_i2.p1 TRINITY_DN16850_c0_g1~~TRINITY_DN16850_c0_g1_i2.p1  ORF type:complete len:659 (+),score=59.96 TRINITY_DN16850_c0_g1_i2:76-2052(+)
MSMYVAFLSLTLLEGWFCTCASYTEAEENEILKIIEKSFEPVKRRPGDFLPSNIKHDKTWEMCTGIDWPANPPLERGTDIFRNMEDELGFKDFCWPGGIAPEDPTCLAVFATVDALKALSERFPEGPMFANAFVVNWGRYDSWAQGAVDAVNLSATPPSAKVNKGNGIIGFAFCDIARTILTQSPNQMGAGICSHVAPLAALARLAPAKIFEMSVRLLWTGKIIPGLKAPCSYFFDRQPGLVPWQNGTAGWVPSEASSIWSDRKSVCTGNEADCSKGSSPAQPAGLTYMFSAAEVGQYSINNHGSCDGRKLFPLTYPGSNPGIKNDQGGNAKTGLWGCRQDIDPVNSTCRVIANPKICGTLPLDLCGRYLSLPIDSSVFDRGSPKIIEFINSHGAYGINLKDPKTQADLQTLMQSDSAAKVVVEYYQEVLGSYADTKYALEALFAVIAYSTTGVWIPSFTEELLEQACNSKVALLTVDATPLTINGVSGQTPFYNSFDGWTEADAQTKLKMVETYFTNAGLVDKIKKYLNDPATAKLVTPSPAAVMKSHGKCDHVVYLESCDARNDIYKIWTWGGYVNLTKATLLGLPVNTTIANGTFNSGIICNAVVADKISWAEIATKEGNNENTELSRANGHHLFVINLISMMTFVSLVSCKLSS